MTHKQFMSGLRMKVYFAQLIVESAGHSLGLPNTSIISLSRFGADIIASTNSGIYKSPDNGTTWVYVGLNGRTIQNLLITSGNDIYAVTSDSGVYHSINGGQTWTRLKLGIESSERYFLGN